MGSSTAKVNELRLKRLQQLRGALRTARGILLQALGNKRRDRGRHLRALRRQRLGLRREVCSDDAMRCIEVEWRPTGEHRIRETAEGIDVRAVIGRRISG